MGLLLKGKVSAYTFIAQVMFTLAIGKKMSLLKEFISLRMAKALKGL